jgi:hypothetical protein
VKQTSPAATFTLIVALTDKLVADQPRNLDLAQLRFHVLCWATTDKGALAGSTS